MPEIELVRHQTLEPHLTAEELAGILRISANKVYAMVKANQIPHSKFGKKISFNPVSIREWLAAHESGSVAPKGGERRHGRKTA